jgi:hypothetical protein
LEIWLEQGGGARNRLDTLARVAIALERHLVVSFPEKVPAHLKDAVQVAWVGQLQTARIAPKRSPMGFAISFAADDQRL